MDIKFNLIELLDKIDKLDDKYAFIHIICLVLPVIIIFNCVRKIIRKILGFIFRIIFFCFYGNDDDEEQESLLQKKPYEESNYNKSNEKELDITDFSPSLSSSKKNKKKKKKSNSNKSSPKISREYLYSTINENIKDEIEYYNPETPGYPYYPPIKYWKQNFETKGGQPPRHEEWLKMVKSIFVETNKSKGIIVRINFPYSER